MHNVNTNIVIFLSEWDLHWSGGNLLHDPDGGFLGAAEGHASYPLLHGVQQLSEVYAGSHGVGHLQLRTREPYV